MSIDSSLYVADIPAATYAIGDIVPLKCIDGPANVRSGRGAAILKQIMVGRFGGGVPVWRIHVKNSDWIDDVSSISGNLVSNTALDDHSGLIQFGCDNSLTPNSGWVVFAECILAGTSTAANSIFALIDVDYPSVNAIADPDELIGIPTTIPYDKVNVAINAFGTLETAGWTTENVDYFKAGYQYCIQAVELSCTAIYVGFLAFSNAAGMGGLQRIIPISGDISGIKYKLRYASKLVKGPMDVKMKLFNSTATTDNVYMCHDYVKRAV